MAPPENLEAHAAKLIDGGIDVAGIGMQLGGDHARIGTSPAIVRGKLPVVSCHDLPSTRKAQLAARFPAPPRCAGISRW